MYAVIGLSIGLKLMLKKQPLQAGRQVEYASLRVVSLYKTISWRPTFDTTWLQALNKPSRVFLLTNAKRDRYF